MNILLLEKSEIGGLIPACDRRVIHIQKILKKGPGDELRAGIVNGDSGMARIVAMDERGMVLSFSAEPEPPTQPLYPLVLLLGFPRPIQARRILKDLTSMGIARIILSGTELGEKSYRESKFFKNSEYHSALMEGAEQAGSPLLPRLETAWSLQKALSLLEATDTPRIALNPGQGAPSLSGAISGWSTESIGNIQNGKHSAVLAVGSERGWTANELAQLKAAGFTEASLGKRILKSETACIVALAVAQAALGLF